jgi:peptidoglycan biosynthesis protein MviN/MurJ (putative lipid II flippase)
VEKWQVAGSLLSIIALRGISHVVEGSQGWLHLSIGRADRWQNWGIVSLLTQVAAVFAGLPFGTSGVAVAGVVASSLIALPSITYAGRPIGIGASLGIRAVGPQLIGAISAAAAGWWLQTAALTDCSIFMRVLLSTGFCISIYLIMVVGMFGLTQPIKVARTVVQDRLWRS